MRSPLDKQVLRTIATTLARTGRFTWRVLKRFSYNKGLLLAGGVAYNTLLSIIPLFAVILVAATHFVDHELVLAVIRSELELIAPGQSGVLAEELSNFFANRHLIGGIGVLVLLFFSSLAFRMLEDALAIIFSQPSRPKSKRSFWVSALIPYAYIVFFTLALLTIAAVSSTLEALAQSDISVLGSTWTPSDLSRLLVLLSGLVGEIFLFTSIFRILPVARVAWRRALVGGVITALLWEFVRQFLHWYFANLSLVSVIYGSFTTAIVILLFMEVATIIILLGAQVIAELERSARADVPWYEEPPLLPLPAPSVPDSAEIPLPDNPEELR